MLKKLPSTEYVPGVAYKPAVPEHEVCIPDPPSGPTPGGGEWVQVCQAVRVYVGLWTQEDVDFGRCTPAQLGTPKYFDYGVICRNEWVPY